MGREDAQPVMARLIRHAAAHERSSRKLDWLIVEAMDAGENQTEIARIVGRSREHLRNVRRRVAEWERIAEEGE